MQGKDSTIPSDIKADRITPACAGKSNIVDAGKSILEDHPCVCREKGISELLRQII